MATDRWVFLKGGRLVMCVENDGCTFVRRGAEAYEWPVTLEEVREKYPSLYPRARALLEEHAATALPEINQDVPVPPMTRAKKTRVKTKAKEAKANETKTEEARANETKTEEPRPVVTYLTLDKETLRRLRRRDILQVAEEAAALVNRRTDTPDDGAWAWRDTDGRVCPLAVAASLVQLEA